jgi:hypothetical protein
MRVLRNCLSLKDIIEVQIEIYEENILEDDFYPAENIESMKQDIIDLREIKFKYGNTALIPIKHVPLLIDVLEGELDDIPEESDMFKTKKICEVFGISPRSWLKSEQARQKDIRILLKGLKTAE